MQPGYYFLGSCFDTLNFFKDPKLLNSRSFEMNRQQAYRVSSFYVGWMDGWCPPFLLCLLYQEGGRGGRERDVYECTPHSSNIEVLMQPGCYFWGSCFDTWYGFKDPKLVNSRSFEMNRQHAYRVSSFYVGWMDGWCPPLLSSLLCHVWEWGEGEREGIIVYECTSHYPTKKLRSGLDVFWGKLFWPQEMVLKNQN